MLNIFNRNTLKFNSNTRSLTNSIVLVLLATVLLSLSGKIYCNIGPVPITAQTLAAYIIGFYLKPTESFFAGLSWTLLGISGAPVFVPGFVSPLTCPSFGYIIGMTLGMPLAKKSNNVLISCIICYLVTSILGCTWLYNFLHSWDLVFKFGIYPFLIGECIKIAIVMGINKIGTKK